MHPLTLSIPLPSRPNYPHTPTTQVAKGRDTRLRSVGNDEREQTLNQLLTELDGFGEGGGLRKEAGGPTFVLLC